ncbi:hypothetical protein EG68_00621 [Paragonimus skrjabini miyazakii]|uniref:Uncharacterized protein n=1 Tax=Paragonimus skrjabini miyazakii TaxID=59628 RepID=A0A8S9Z7U2_9TREM|nr:hypothetical protein EG68_00621 [Paragonimus skrjabini miyazakii]
MVYIQGTKPKNAPVLLTVPDLGCDHTYYTKFVNAHMRGRFCWCHIELPGQTFDSSDWGSDSDNTQEAEDVTNVGAEKLIKGAYPTMQELAEGIQTILEKLQISQVVLFGEGSGANLLARVAILCDHCVLGALLINGRCTPSGPLQLLREKMRNWKSNKLEPATEKYLLEHRYSAITETCLPEPLKSEFLIYKNNLNERVNMKNLNLLTYSYAHRTSLADMITGLKCPVLLIAGTLSGHRAGVRNMYETLNKAHKNSPQSRVNFELIEIEDSRSPLIEKPEKVAETALYFLQGLGIVTSARHSLSSSSGDATNVDVTPSSPEKRTCADLVNLDSTPDESQAALVEASEISSRKQSDSTETGYPKLPTRYFGRQMSMAELDLPRGPNALSSFKEQAQSVNRSPQRTQPDPLLGHSYPSSLEQAHGN